MCGARVRCFTGIPLTKPVRARNVTASDGEFDRVYDAAQPRLRLALLLCRDAAIRLGTVVKLKAEHIDLERNLIASRTKAYGTYCVPMTRRLRALVELTLAVNRDGDTLLQTFSTCRGVDKPVSRSAINTELRVLQKKLGIPPSWHFHDLRRTAARRLYEQSGDLRKVQRLLGHSSIQATLWYLEDCTTQLTGDELEPKQGPRLLPMEKRLA